MRFFKASVKGLVRLSQSHDPLPIFENPSEKSIQRSSSLGFSIVDCDIIDLATLMQIEVLIALLLIGASSLA